MFLSRLLARAPQAERTRQEIAAALKHRQDRFEPSPGGPRRSPGPLDRSIVEVGSRENHFICGTPVDPARAWHCAEDNLKAVEFDQRSNAIPTQATAVYFDDCQRAFESTRTDSVIRIIAEPKGKNASFL